MAVNICYNVNVSWTLDTNDKEYKLLSSSAHHCLINKNGQGWEKHLRACIYWKLINFGMVTLWKINK